MRYLKASNAGTPPRLKEVSGDTLSDPPGYIPQAVQFLQRAFVPSPSTAEPYSLLFACLLT